MTEKDKKLLVIMLIGVIIVAIGYWGIIPQISAYSDLEAKIEKEEETQKINKLKINNTMMIEMSAEDYEEKLTKVKDKFYPIMTSAEVDMMLTEMATKRGLTIYELNFSMPKTPTERRAYVNSQLYQEQEELIKAYKDGEKEKDSSKKSSKSDSDEEDSTSSSKSSSSSSKTSSKATQEVMEAIAGVEEGGYHPNTEIFAVPITFTVGGEKQVLEDFLEEIGDLEKTSLLTSYAWGEYRTYVIRDAYGNIISTDDTTIPQTTVNEQGETVTTNVPDGKIRKSLTVRLELYMCDTSIVDDVEEDGEYEEVETVE